LREKQPSGRTSLPSRDRPHRGLAVRTGRAQPHRRGHPHRRRVDRAV